MRIRLQSLTVLAAAALAGLLFTAVFAPPGDLVRLVVLVLVPAGAACFLRPARSALRPLAGLAGGLLVLAELPLWTTTARGLPTTATARALVSGVTDSWARTLDTTWPARPEPALVLFVPLLVLVAGVLGVELLRRADQPVLSVLPGVVVAGLAEAYSAERGRHAIELGLAYGLVLVVLLAAAAGARLGRPRWSAVSPALGRLGLLVVAVGLGAGVLGPLDPLGRPAYSLKAHRQAEVLPASAISPLSQLTERLRRPDTVVFLDRTASPVDRWPVAVLDRFDGQEWTSSARYQPFGGTLPADAGITARTARHTAVLKISDLTGPWLPSQSRTEAVDGLDPFVDPVSGTLLTDQSLPGIQYALTWTAPELTAAQLSAAALDPSAAAGWSSAALPAGLADIARTATGGQPPSVTTALQLERYLREHYKVASGRSQPAGHGYPQIEHFLVTSKRGTSEQFAAAYVILARAAGIPARLVVGFRQPASPDAEGSFAVHNGDALAWPEIAVTGVGWVPLDPTARAGDSGESGDGLAAATAKARESLPPPNQITPEDPALTGATTTDPEAPHERSLLLPILAGLVLVLLLLVAAIPGTKALRRRHRRTAPPVDAVRGAWQEVRDRLADNGLLPPPGATPRAVAAEARPLLGERVEALSRLGAHLDAALWSGTTADPALATTAWSEVDSVRTALANRPVRARLAAALAVRTLLPDQGRGASVRQAAPRMERVSL